VARRDPYNVEVCIWNTPQWMLHGVIRTWKLGFLISLSGRQCGSSWGAARHSVEKSQFTNNSRSNSIIMNSKIAHLLMAAALVFPGAALAQAQSSTPDAPGATSAPAPSNKIGTINVEAAIYSSNEGMRDFEALNKTEEPKQTELKSKNDELEALKKQLNTQGDKLNESARATLVSDISSKQKTFDRDMQDARDDYQSKQQEVAQKILQKMAPVIEKYASDNNYGLIVDTSTQWPQGPVLWRNPSVDITKAVVDAYNLKSGVAAPPPAAPAPHPASNSRPSTRPATKPATPAAH
jgi:outer membrane protein